VPSRHPFDIRYAADLPETAWERCAQVLDRYDVQRLLRTAWAEPPVPRRDASKHVAVDIC
jgi:hypothetical protein